MGDVRNDIGLVLKCTKKKQRCREELLDNKCQNINKEILYNKLINCVKIAQFRNLWKFFIKDEMQVEEPNGESNTNGREEE
jgi:hypothetical protein